VAGSENRLMGAGQVREEISNFANEGRVREIKLQ